MSEQRGPWNPATQIVFIGGRWLILPSDKSTIFEAEGLFEELYSLHAAAEIPEDRRAALVTCGLLLEDGSSESSATTIDRFNRMRRPPFADYARGEVVEFDRSLMDEYASERYPPLTLRHDGRRSYLPHPAVVNAVQQTNVFGLLLFAAFGRQRTAHLHERFPVLLKCVPSCGARHPFEAYLEVGALGPLDAGLYHYNVDEHALVYLGECEQDLQEVRLHVAAVFDRSQWRYRATVGFLDLLVDLGHVLETVKAVSWEIGFQVREVPPDKLKNFGHDLVTEVVASLGLTETTELPCNE